MSNRAAAILAVAAVISSLCIYGTFAQVPERPAAADVAIVVGQPPALGHELPGRYQLARMSDSSVMVIDTHTGQCWSKFTGQPWRDWGSPVK